MYRGDEIDAVHRARHVHISNDQRDVVVRVEHCERFFRIPSLENGRAGVLQNVGGDEANERFVVDDQDGAARQSTHNFSLRHRQMTCQRLRSSKIGDADKDFWKS